MTVCFFLSALNFLEWTNRYHRRNSLNNVAYQEGVRQAIVVAKCASAILFLYVTHHLGPYLYNSDCLFRHSYRFLRSVESLVIYIEAQYSVISNKCVSHSASPQLSA